MREQLKGQKIFEDQQLDHCCQLGLGFVAQESPLVIEVLENFFVCSS